MGDTERSTLNRQIEQRRAVARRRIQQGRLGVDVGNNAHPVALIKNTGLAGNVRGRIVQAEKRFEPAAGHLGDPLARVVGVKAVDHDAVEAAQDFRLPRGFLGELLDRRGLANAPQHQANQLARIQLRLDDAWLGFDDEIGA